MYIILTCPTGKLSSDRGSVDIYIYLLYLHLY